jgi:hypothetical protein
VHCTERMRRTVFEEIERVGPRLERQPRKRLSAVTEV